MPLSAERIEAAEQRVAQVDRVAGEASEPKPDRVEPQAGAEGARDLRADAAQAPRR